MGRDAASLARHMDWLYTSQGRTCLCPHEYLSLGVADGIKMGHGWLRTDTNPECPEHGGRDSQ